MLYYFHGLSTEETARLLDVSRDAVKKRLQRARTTLRSRWGPRLASLMFAFPWWCADTAASAVGLAGGLVMKKAAVVVAILIALAATTVGFVWQRGGEREREQPSHSSLATRNVPEPAVEKKAVDSDAADLGVEDDYSGIVVTPDGQPAEGASVRIGAYFLKTGGRISMLVRATKTDSDGRFTLGPHFKDNVAAVEYHAHAAGYAWTSERSRPDQNARIVLLRGGTLIVNVWSEDGTPVEGAMQFVRRRGENGFEDFLNAFRVDAQFDLVPGEYEVRCQATGLVPSRRTVVKVVSDKTTRLEVKLLTGVDYGIHVVDPEGQGVEGASVEVRGPGASGGEATTDRSGRCRIAGIGIPHKVGANPFEGAHFTVKAEGFAPFSKSIRVPESEGEEEVHLALRRGARVVFRCRGVDGKPLKKQSVYIFYNPSDPPSIGHQLWLKTDDNGEVVCPALEKGTAMVQVMEIEKHPRTIKLTGKPQEVLIDLRPGDHDLVGRVHAADGMPAAGGEVGFVPLAQEKKGPGIATRSPIAADGSFRIPGLEAGEGSLWVWAPGVEAQYMPVRVPSESVEMRLREANRVAGTVVTRAGVPVPGVPVRLERYFGNWTEVGTVTTDAKGRFAFCGVGDDPKLHLRVRNNKKWIESHGLGYTVGPGDMTVRLTVKAESEGWGLKIPIDVLDDRGRPLHGRMDVSYTRDGKRGRWPLIPKATETPGRFMLVYYDLPGTCDLRFSMTGHLPVEIAGVVIADTDEQPTLRVVFDRGADLAVVARHPDGTPVANTTLKCGGVVVRTDAHGRAEFGGFRPGVRRVEIYKESDYYLHSGSIPVELPGRAEVVLMRRGVVIGRAEGKGSFHWKLVDADGVVRDERTTDAPWTRLFTTVGGRHRLVVRHGETVSEHEVAENLGHGVSVGPKSLD